MTTTIFNMTRDVAGNNGFGVMPSTVKYGALLTQNVAQTVTVPSDYSNYIAIFTYTPGAHVFVAYDDTATAFSGTMSAVDSELNPIGRQLKAGQVISLLTPDTNGAYVGVVFYVILPFGN
jgi:hypothetical protein